MYVRGFEGNSSPVSLILSHTCGKDPSETNRSHRPTFQWENELGANHEVSQQNTNRAVQTYQACR